MILIKPNVKAIINDYVNYLINEGITSKERAYEKIKFNDTSYQ